MINETTRIRNKAIIRWRK